MALKFKTIFSKGSKQAKPRPESDPKPNHTKPQDVSDSTCSIQLIDDVEAKRKAWEAKKEKEAEDWLWKQGFVSRLPSFEKQLDDDYLGTDR